MGQSDWEQLAMVAGCSPYLPLRRCQGHVLRIDIRRFGSKPLLRQKTAALSRCLNRWPSESLVVLTKDPYVSRDTPYFWHTAAIRILGRLSMMEYCATPELVSMTKAMNGLCAHLNLIGDDADMSCPCNEILAGFLHMFAVKVDQSYCRN